jgi:hypothetical protein
MPKQTKAQQAAAKRQREQQMLAHARASARRASSNNYPEEDDLEKAIQRSKVHHDQELRGEQDFEYQTSLAIDRSKELAKRAEERALRQKEEAEQRTQECAKMAREKRAADVLGRLPSEPSPENNGGVKIRLHHLAHKHLRRFRDSDTIRTLMDWAMSVDEEIMHSKLFELILPGNKRIRSNDKSAMKNRLAGLDQSVVRVYICIEENEQAEDAGIEATLNGANSSPSSGTKSKNRMGTSSSSSSSSNNNNESSINAGQAPFESKHSSVIVVE